MTKRMLLLLPVPTRMGCLAGSLIGLSAWVAGCSFLGLKATHQNEDHTNLILAAARVHEINMFGDLDGTRSGRYQARASVSLKQHTFTEVGKDFDPNINEDGDQLVFASTRHNMQPDLYFKAIDGVAVTQLTSDPASDVQPVFDPDGERVAFASNRSGNWDIWVVNVNGGQPVQITSSVADEIHPSWSPDGSQLVYCSLPRKGGPWELWIVDTDNGATRKFIGFGLFPAWSPEDDTIVYQRARERGSRLFSIWTVKLEDGEPGYPTEVAASASHAFTLPTWSRDGERIAFVSVAYVEVASREGSGKGSPTPAVSDLSDIWMVSSKGFGRIRLTDSFTSNYSPVFAPDGRLFFTTGRSGHDTIWSLSPFGSMDGGFGADRTTMNRSNSYRVPSLGGERLARSILGLDKPIATGSASQGRSGGSME